MRAPRCENPALSSQCFLKNEQSKANPTGAAPTPRGHWRPSSLRGTEGCCGGVAASPAACLQPQPACRSAKQPNSPYSYFHYLSSASHGRGKMHAVPRPASGLASGPSPRAAAGTADFGRDAITLALNKTESGKHGNEFGVLARADISQIAARSRGLPAGAGRGVRGIGCRRGRAIGPGDPPTTWPPRGHHVQSHRAPARVHGLDWTGLRLPTRFDPSTGNRTRNPGF